MSAAPPPIAEPERYELRFLTDQWEWEEEIQAATPDDAKDRAREALIALIREEKPDLACITLAKGGVKIGVWDWVEAQAYWSLL